MFIIYDNITCQTLSKYFSKEHPYIEWSDAYYMDHDLDVQEWLPDEAHRFRTQKAAETAVLRLEKVLVRHQGVCRLDFKIFEVHRHVSITYRSMPSV